MLMQVLELKCNKSERIATNMKYMLPLVITLIICISCVKRKNTYSDFTEGAADGLKIVIGIFPPILAICVAAAMLRASGAFDMLLKVISPITQKLSIPNEVIPLALMRPISGSGSTALLIDTLNTYGADGRIGRLASIIMGSTETTFYCMGVYFSKTGIKNTIKALPYAVLGDLLSIALACVGERLFF